MHLQCISKFCPEQKPRNFKHLFVFELVHSTKTANISNLICCIIDITLIFSEGFFHLIWFLILVVATVSKYMVNKQHGTSDAYLCSGEYKEAIFYITLSPRLVNPTLSNLPQELLNSPGLKECHSFTCVYVVMNKEWLHRFSHR